MEHRRCGAAVLGWEAPEILRPGFPTRMVQSRDRKDLVRSPGGVNPLAVHRRSCAGRGIVLVPVIRFEWVALRPKRVSTYGIQAEDVPFPLPLLRARQEDLISPDYRRGVPDPRNPHAPVVIRRAEVNRNRRCIAYPRPIRSPKPRPFLRPYGL